MKEQKALDLIRQFVDEYPKTEYPSVNDELLIKLMRGLRGLDINYVVLPEDDSVCPDCKYIHGKLGKKAISLHVHFGNNVLCKYCSCAGEYKSIMKHNMGDCKHPTEPVDKNGKRQWTKDDCLLLFNDFKEYYEEILNEL